MSKNNKNKFGDSVVNPLTLVLLSLFALGVVTMCCFSAVKNVSRNKIPVEDNEQWSLVVPELHRETESITVLDGDEENFDEENNGTLTDVNSSESVTSKTTTSSKTTTTTTKKTTTTTTTKRVVAPTKLTPSKNSVSLAIGSTKKIKITFGPADTTQKGVKWTSTNPSVAKVKDDGTIVAVAAGTCSVKAVSTANAKASCTVSVTVTEGISSTYKITVFIGSQSVVVYKKGADGKYSNAVRVITCSTGTTATPTRTGNYQIRKKYRWKELMGPSWGQYCSSISSAYLFHSVPYNRKNDPTSMSMGGYAKLGSRASHGCIRMACIDAKWIYDNVPVGTSVLVTNEAGPYGPSPVATKKGDKYKGWDPTDPNPDSPYNKTEKTTTTTSTTTKTTTTTTKTTTKTTTTTTKTTTSATTTPTTTPAPESEPVEEEPAVG